jgi:hypothetical protein
MTEILRLATIAVSLLFAYQAFDSLRSAFTGEQPKASAPNPDPKAPSARAGGLVWGLMSASLALVGLYYALFHW